MNARHYKFTTQDIAGAMGRSAKSIRRDMSNGKFDPEDILSVSVYIMIGVLKNESKGIRHAVEQ